MIERTQYLEMIRERLKRFPVVSVLGPRQVGKTTLAQQIAGEQPSHFFDLEDVDAQARLAEPKVALERLTGLVVLDELQRMSGHPEFDVHGAATRTMARECGQTAGEVAEGLPAEQERSVGAHRHLRSPPHGFQRPRGREVLSSER